MKVFLILSGILSLASCKPFLTSKNIAKGSTMTFKHDKDMSGSYFLTMKSSYTEVCSLQINPGNISSRDYQSDQTNHRQYGLITFRNLPAQKPARAILKFKLRSEKKIKELKVSLACYTKIKCTYQDGPCGNCDNECQITFYKKSELTFTQLQLQKGYFIADITSLISEKFVLQVAIFIPGQKLKTIIDPVLYLSY